MTPSTPTVEWVREPVNRWSRCSNDCGRSGRWMLHIMGRTAGKQVCEGCKRDMQAAWDSALPATDGAVAA